MEERPLVVVTAATDNYFRKLQDLIGSVHQHDSAPLYVYDIGLTAPQVSELNRYWNVEYRKFDYDKYPPFIKLSAAPLSPDFVRERNAGMRQALKLLILFEIMEEIPNPVLWLDAGTHIERPLDPVREEIRKYGYFFTCVSNDRHMQRWTHIGTLQALGCPQYKEYLGHTSTGSMGFGGRDSWAFGHIARPARDCVLQKECIEPDGASLRNHRYDASVISALLEANGIARPCSGKPYERSVPIWNTNMPASEKYVIYHSRGNTIDPEHPERFRFPIRCTDGQLPKHIA
jgi:hypothetical protein